MFQNLLKNFHNSPVSTIAGLVTSALLVMTGQPDAKHLVMAFAVALWGSVTKEK